MDAVLFNHEHVYWSMMTNKKEWPPSFFFLAWEWPPFHRYKSKAVLDYDLWFVTLDAWNASAVLWCGHWTWGDILYSWPLTLHCYLRLKEGISISIYTSYPSFIRSRKRRARRKLKSRVMYEMAQANPWKEAMNEYDASIADTSSLWKPIPLPAPDENLPFPVVSPCPMMVQAKAKQKPGQAPAIWPVFLLKSMR